MNTSQQSKDVKIQYGIVDTDYVTRLRQIAASEDIRPQLFQATDGTLKLFPVSSSTGGSRVQDLSVLESCLKLLEGQAGTRGSKWKSVNPDGLTFEQSIRALEALEKALNQTSKLVDLLTSKAQGLSSGGDATKNLAAILQTNAASAIAGLYKSQMTSTMWPVAKSFSTDPAAARQTVEAMEKTVARMMKLEQQLLEEYNAVYGQVSENDAKTLLSNAFQDKTPSEVLDYIKGSRLSLINSLADSIQKTFTERLRRLPRVDPGEPDPKIVNTLTFLLRGTNVTDSAIASSCPSDHPLAKSGIQAAEIARVANTILALPIPGFQMSRNTSNGLISVRPSWGPQGKPVSSSGYDAELNLDKVMPIASNIQTEDPLEVPLEVTDLDLDTIGPAIEGFRAEVNRLKSIMNGLRSERESIASKPRRIIDTTQLELELFRATRYRSQMYTTTLPMITQLESIRKNLDGKHPVDSQLEKKVYDCVTGIMDLEPEAWGGYFVNYKDAIGEEEEAQIVHASEDASEGLSYAWCRMWENREQHAANLARVGKYRTERITKGTHWPFDALMNAEQETETGLHEPSEKISRLLADGIMGWWAFDEEEFNPEGPYNADQVKRFLERNTRGTTVNTYKGEDDPERSKKTADQKDRRRGRAFWDRLTEEVAKSEAQQGQQG
jgi:hypothetical protein